jgi:hypothetical protein
MKIKEVNGGVCLDATRISLIKLWRLGFYVQELFKDIRDSIPAIVLDYLRRDIED